MLNRLVIEGVFCYGGDLMKSFKELKGHFISSSALLECKEMDDRPLSQFLPHLYSLAGNTVWIRSLVIIKPEIVAT